MIDVLNLEWNATASRDRVMSSLVSNYLRYQGYTVVEESIFRGFEMIKRYRPRVLFVANGIGSEVNFQIVKYAASKGIKVVTLVSEGNFKDDLLQLPIFLWGWNKDQVLYEDIHLQWSDRTRKMTAKVYPRFEGKVKVSGGCGFDIYKINRPVDKKSFLDKFGKECYKKIIGVGCWDFSCAFPGTYRTNLSLAVEVARRFMSDRDNFNKILLAIIKANPDVLFILKEHPGNVFGHAMSGIEGADSFNNVLILKKESIFDVISVSDIWLTYESTTVIEAWMMGKPTCLLNPSGVDFPRANVYKGSPNFPDIVSLQEAMNSFYSIGVLPHFNDQDMRNARQEVIEDTIQWSDGLNHVRAGNAIIDVINSKYEGALKSIPFSIRKQQLKQWVINSLHIKQSSIYQRSSAFKSSDVQSYSSKLYEQQLDFYESKGLSTDELAKIVCI